MKIYKSILVASLLALPGIAAADITFTFDAAPGTLNVIEVPAEGGEEVTGSMAAEGLNAVYKPTSSGALRVVFIPQGGRSPLADVYLSAPDENVEVTVKDGKASYSGTPLMNGVSEIKNVINDYTERIRKVMKGESTEDADALEKEANGKLMAIIDANPQSPSAPYALLMLDGDDFMEYYNKMAPTFSSSIFAPMIEKQKASVEKEMSFRKLYEKLESGAEPAPNFSLPNPEGKMVSLDQFRGKWVILDFWGSWCGWCIKGIPELKEAYNKYQGKLEIIGIDCRDDREDWLEAIKKYDLPWVHVYNDTDNNDAPDRVDKEYGIQGFPTKIIISPEGFVKKIVVGEDPNFYNILADYLK